MVNAPKENSLRLLLVVKVASELDQLTVKLPEFPLLVDNEKTIGVQVNGKLRGQITININDNEETIKEKAMQEENVLRFIEGKEIIKTIVIKGKIVNIVVK